MRFTPISRPRLTAALAEYIAGTPRPDGPWWRVAVDGAPAAGPGALADELAEALPPLGHPVGGTSHAEGYGGGGLLLGRGLPLDLAVHLRLSPGALERRTDPAERWTLPAYARYSEEAMPEEAADVVVRADDPRHPAWTWGDPAHRPG